MTERTDGWMKEGKEGPGQGQKAWGGAWDRRARTALVRSELELGAGVLCRGGWAVRIEQPGWEG